MATPLVSFKNVAKRYYMHKALVDVNFELFEGEIFGFIGPNGAGKTTTLKILVGLLQNFEGEVMVSGFQLPQDHHKVHQLIGYLPQAPEYQAWRSIEDVLIGLGQLSGVSKAELKRRIPPLLERFELKGLENKKVAKLSGGMKQKVGLIQALLHKPKLLILDEPLGGLDPVSRRKVKEVIQELRSQGVTIIFSSHILSDVQDVADRIGILHRGQMLATGTLTELKAKFGIPNDIHVVFSQLPDALDYLSEIPGVTEVKQRKDYHFVLPLDPNQDEDTAVHQLITETLKRNGRLRKIGNIAPNLDELYTRYIESTIQRQEQPA
ncbi:MAG TPA: ABC transporter ATP-binding protein [Bacteroidetes bacterium]|nr:ABC transporter ATP-binding protein [Bacteroidota bacterium]